FFSWKDDLHAEAVPEGASGSGRCAWWPGTAASMQPSMRRSARSPQSWASPRRRPCASGSAGPRSTPGQRPGVTSEEPAEIRRLRAEVRELRLANEILKAASAFFAAELDRCQPPDRTGVKKLTRPRVMRLLLPASLWWYGQIRRQLQAPGQVRSHGEQEYGFAKIQRARSMLVKTVHQFRSRRGE